MAQGPATTPVPAPPTFFWTVHKWLYRITAFFFYWWAIGFIIYATTNENPLRFSHWMLLGPVLMFAFEIVRRYLEHKYATILAIQYPLYIFPFFLGKSLWWIVRGTPHVTRTVTGGFRPLTNLPAGLCWLSMLCFVWIWLLTVETPFLLYSLLGFQIILNTMLLLTGLRLAGDPLRPFVFIGDFFAWSCQQVDTHYFSRSQPLVEVLKTKSASLVRTNTETHVRYADWCERTVQKVKEHYDYLTTRTLVPAFSLVLILMFTSTVIGYGCAIYAVQRHEKPFEKLEPSLGHCLVFSLSILTTAPLSDVTFKSDVAYWIYGAELTSTFLIGSLFFSMFAASMSVHGPQRSNEVVQTLNATVQWIESKRQLFRRVLAQLDELERPPAITAPPPASGTPSASATPPPDAPPPSDAPPPLYSPPI
jgi:hypothetical protein